jgi:hypothetical protein
VFAPDRNFTPTSPLQECALALLVHSSADNPLGESLNFCPIIHELQCTFRACAHTTSRGLFFTGLYDFSRESDVAVIVELKQLFGHGGAACVS